jgi:hypothetical protein
VEGPIYIKVDVTPPTITLTAIPNLLKTKWEFIINVSDETSGVSSVEIYIDGVPFVNLTSPPWDFAYAGPGKFVQAMAYDNAGNEGKSNIVQDLGLFVDSQPTPTPNGMLSVQQRLLQQR